MKKKEDVFKKGALRTIITDLKDTHFVDPKYQEERDRSMSEYLQAQIENTKSTYKEGGLYRFENGVFVEVAVFDLKPVMKKEFKSISVDPMGLDRNIASPPYDTKIEPSKVNFGDKKL